MLVIMQTQITKLDNGLRVVTAHMAEAWSVTAGIFVGVGSRHESFEDNGGVSHFLEHLLFKGTKQRPSAKVISEEVDALGGWNNAYTSQDHTCYYLKVPAEHAAKGIDILADMVRNATLVTEEVDRERSVVIEEMNVYRDDPARYVGWLLPGLLWPHNSLGNNIIGSEEVIKSISRDDIFAYKQHFYAPNNMVVAVSGKLDHKAVVSQVQQLLGDMVPAETQSYQPVDGGPSSELAQVQQKETNQSHFIIGALGYPYNHQQEAAQRVLVNIMGQGMSSRLFINVRERKGLAYSVHASSQRFTDSGVIEIYAGVNLAKTSEAVDAVIEELDKVKSELVSEQELTKAKNQIKGSLQMGLENNINVTMRNGRHLLLLDEVRDAQELIAEVEEITPREVAEAAKDIFADNKLRLSLITPEPEPVVEAFKQRIKQ